MTGAVDFVAAEARAGTPAALRIADVVFRADQCECPRRWLGDALARWPGSLMAAARSGRRDCLIMVRGQAPLLFRVRVGGREGPVLACAAVAYWWTVSGRPPAELAGRRFAVTISRPG